MKVGGGNLKGSRFEREVCRDLSLWISNGVRDDLLWRSAMSGGRATIGLRTGNVRSSQAGDVSLIDVLGEKLLSRVVVECKSYKDLNVVRGIINDTGFLYLFWCELVNRAVKFNKQPMLIARQNGIPAMCLLPSWGYSLFGLTEDHASAILPRWGCHLFLFDCFLREAKVPDDTVYLNYRNRVRLAGVTDYRASSS